MNPFKVIPMALLALFGLIVVMGSYFTVETTEVAFVRRFGQVQNDQPITTGLHFKLPMFDTVDKIQISVDTMKFEKIQVHTVDNQSVDLNAAMTYQIPASSAYHLLYEVGSPGHFGIAENVTPIIRDRIMKVFSQKNTITISDERTKISAEINKSISEVMHQIFGIQVIDFQLASINYSEQFRQSIEKAVQAKNDAVTAENKVREIKYQADQLREKANGERDAAIAQAQGAAQANLLKSKAEAESKLMLATSEAKAIEMKSAALEKNGKLVELTIAEQWNGQLPQYMLGNGTLPMLSLPTTEPSPFVKK